MYIISAIKSKGCKERYITDYHYATEAKDTGIFFNNQEGRYNHIGKSGVQRDHTEHDLRYKTCA
ncbi:hypothetical protein KSU1_C0796 [Candidatus Jettenia caeni]|uniref:Uncharacterized protein n=1 Tax=Candidatus Jettenia caeni TaxID=247490 RepID=I3IKZ7_9BACT|nr:hypothetical protein KSU1_C0796 [Candidatus Jettenia caeni]